MSIYQELNIIDDFEERAGNSGAVRRACDFMVSYLSKTRVPLPELAEQGLEIAIKYMQGEVGGKELDHKREEIADFLRLRSATLDFVSPEFRGLHAVEAILSCYGHPAWGGGASELVSNFLDVMEIVDGGDSFRTLLREHFPATKDDDVD
jgi:hypothetical protein